MRFKRTLIAVLLGLGVLGGGAAVVAAAGEGCWRGEGGWGGPAGWSSPAGWGGHRGWGRGGGRLCSPQRGERIEGMLAGFEAFAKFTPPQQTAWDELKRKVEAGNVRFDEACAAMGGDPAAATPDARLAGIERMLEAGLATVREVRPAFDAFYASLDAAQRAAVDRMMRPRRG